MRSASAGVAGLPAPAPAVDAHGIVRRNGDAPQGFTPAYSRLTVAFSTAT